MSFVEIVQNLGVVGLFISMFLEGSSLPFPGVIVVLSYGFLLNPSYVNLVAISIGMAMIYTLASFIPYLIGLKMSSIFPKKLQKGINKARCWFQKYGTWSISLSRPFGMGNYISYIAGMSEVKASVYTIHTFLGILPWSFSVLLIGKFGNEIAIRDFFKEYQIYIYSFLIVVLLIYGLYIWWKATNNTNEVKEQVQKKEMIDSEKQQNLAPMFETLVRGVRKERKKEVMK
ncbi:DedA family protein [Cytobacillus sp. Hm23]